MQKKEDWELPEGMPLYLFTRCPLIDKEESNCSKTCCKCGGTGVTYPMREKLNSKRFF